jgi:isopentenyl phosphate kinase
MLTLVKIGGSLITDKTQKASFRQAVMEHLAQEIQQALSARPDLNLIVGHGSGSFGHFEAKQHGTMQGVHTPEQWRGFARVALVASELNFYVSQALHHAGVTVMRFQPSASIMATDGVITQMATDNIELAARRGIVPLVYGDVAFDNVRGGTIVSTETVFTTLVQRLPVREVILLGEVDGVYDLDKRVIPEISPENYVSIRPALGGSEGVDVTGGMLTKVSDMLALAQSAPQMKIRIINGMRADILRQTLLGEGEHGTLIHA